MAGHDHAAEVRGEQDAADRGEHSAGESEDREDCEDSEDKEDLHILQNWLTLIEANYHATNSYHNSSHAADVLQVKTRSRGLLRDCTTSPINRFAALI